MNVILVCLDTFRADCVAAAGRNDFIKTPNLDRLVSEGVLFENAFTEGLPTIQYRRALCAGMRSFPYERDVDTTGTWPSGPGWHKIPPEQRTLAEVLLDNGFATGMAADTYHLFKPTMNFTRGMASWEFIRGQESDNYRSGPLSAINLSKYTTPDLVGKRNALLIQYLLNMQDRKGEMDYLPAKVFSSAIRFIEDNKDNQPFFLWVDSFDPHEPWDPPREYADMYAPDWDEDYEPIMGAATDDEKIRRRVKALYYGEVTFVDKQIGRLLDTLERTGLIEDTLVIVMSDHGTEVFWDHGGLHKGVHGNRYRCVCEVLCVMRFPGREHAGKRIRPFIQNQDFFPTILGLHGIEHGPVDGADFMPLITGEKDALRDHIVVGSGRRAAVRTLDYAWSCDYLKEDLNEYLFDLKADPGEMNNIAADCGEVAAEYRRRAEDFLGQKLPYKPKWKTYPYPMPAAVWLNKAPWAKALRG